MTGQKVNAFGHQDQTVGAAFADTIPKREPLNLISQLRFVGRIALQTVCEVEGFLMEGVALSKVQVKVIVERISVKWNHEYRQRTELCWIEKRVSGGEWSFVRKQPK